LENNLKTCIHVLNINNYFPELFELTIKTIKRFANKIFADLNIIIERKYPNFPLLTEKLQVYDFGLNYDWNLLIDADILIHPNTYNPLLYLDPRYVGCKDNYHAYRQLKMDRYFIRDGRHVGLSSCVIATSKLTHDLWEFPNDLSKEEILNNILQDRKIVDEYVISRNLAKYGLKYKELFKIQDYDLFYHLGRYAQESDKILELAKSWYLENL
jgi:hypothetical protein